MKISTAAGKKVWTISNGEIDVAVTIEGGHMAPVRFFADDESSIEPYAISPWQEEQEEISGPGVLKSLRGDFFCMPFGGDNTWKDEVHPPHGEVCEASWNLVSAGKTGDGQHSIVLDLNTEVRPGHVTKTIKMLAGHSALYVSHRIEGFTGPVTLGHHAILPGDRVHYLDCPPLKAGLTDTAPPPPGSREYFSALPGTFFDDLSSVPSIWKSPSELDYSVFPAREGYVDILQVFPQAPVDESPLWFTATVPEHRYLWFSLKHPEILPSTVLWQENFGRHAAPWNGRNSCIGIEEVLGHLASGLRTSVEPNILSKKGLSTYRELDGQTPFVVRNIQGVCRIPEGFDRVDETVFGDRTVLFRSRSGQEVQIKLDWKFLFE